MPKFDPNAITPERLQRGDITPQQVRQARLSPGLRKRLHITVPKSPEGAAKMATFSTLTR